MDTQVLVKVRSVSGRMHEKRPIVLAVGELRDYRLRGERFTLYCAFFNID